MPVVDLHDLHLAPPSLYVYINSMLQLMESTCVGPSTVDLREMTEEVREFLCCQKISMSTFMQERATDPCIVVNFSNEAMLARCMQLRETTLRVQQPQQGAGGLPCTTIFETWVLEISDTQESQLAQFCQCWPQTPTW